MIIDKNNIVRYDQRMAHKVAYT